MIMVPIWGILFSKLFSGRGWECHESGCEVHGNVVNSSNSAAEYEKQFVQGMEHRF